jgi:hypothetical protein
LTEWQQSPVGVLSRDLAQPVPPDQVGSANLAGVTVFVNARPADEGERRADEFGMPFASDACAPEGASAKMFALIGRAARCLHA